MRTTKLSIRAGFLGVAVALLLLPGLSRATGSLIEATIHATPIGKPVWQPVDFHLFSAPIGVPDDNFAGFDQTLQALLPPPHHLFDVNVGVLPGAPHSPPYSNELAHGVARVGLKDTLFFHPAQFAIPNGVYLIWMLVPGPSAPKGSSPDFKKGPIIPNELFPISVSGFATRNGAEFDPALVPPGKTIPKTTDLPTPINVNGYSHVPEFAADALDFGPPGTDPVGLYEYAFTLIDAAGNGWKFNAFFLVL